MKNSLLPFPLLLFCNFLFSQTTPYFQQQVDYNIQVTLDDVHHTLSGTIEMVYTNNSPDELSQLYLHLWANAFKDNTSAFAKQKLRTGSDMFYFSHEKDRGYYSGLDFTINGQKAAWHPDPENPDIAVATLPQPLKSGGKMTISTPFTEKIPASFSRLGHVVTSYQMTQWYPKPAVYDRKGWHAMPYLDMGEFYSEFGSFDVSITLPENYVVGATGVLQTESERAFLMKKVEETQGYMEKGFPAGKGFPASDSTMKTIRYTAENVHDFAWFADKRFYVQKGEVTLASGQKVDTWTMFTNEQTDLWRESINYVNRAVEFYSKYIGEYPWPQATAVHSALSAGGGMEYPMITVIGHASGAKDLDQVITHEVGHNWFYGILGTNERDHAWMDEGMNSYYEYRYTTGYYGDRVVEQLPAFIKKGTDMDLYEAAYLFNARRRLDQAPETTSGDFSTLNYGVASYMKPGIAFGHLENYFGTARFDAIMQSYFQKWKFRHPYPEDLRSHFEAESGVDLGWFFQGYLGSNGHLDYAVKSISGNAGNFKIILENKGEIAAPFPLTGYRHGEQVETRWVEGFTGEKEIEFPGCDCDEFRIDPAHLTLEVFRKNNNIKTKGTFKKGEPLQLKFPGALEDSRFSTLYWTPIAGGNKYDGPMAGLALYNTVVPAKKFEFALAYLYGFDSKDVVGMERWRYNIYPKSEKVKKVTLGIDSRVFSYLSLHSLATETGFASPTLKYRRNQPFVRVDLMRSHASAFYQTLQFRTVFLGEQFASFASDTTGVFYQGKEWNNRAISELSWELGDRRMLNPFSLRMAIEHQRYDDPFEADIKRSYVRASLEYNMSYAYEKGRYQYLRIFVGGFLKNDQKERGYAYPGAFNLTSQGFNDYRYDDLYFGRTETTGFLSQQIMLKDGGMKIPLGSPQQEGRSRNFIVAINLKADLPQDLPLKLPLKPYFDIAWYDDARTISSGLSFNDQLWWQGGLALEFGKGAVGIYFPVVNSKNLRGGDKLAGLYDASGRDTFWKRIAFSVDLMKLNPWDLIDGLSL